MRLRRSVRLYFSFIDSGIPDTLRYVSRFSSEFCRTLPSKAPTLYAMQTGFLLSFVACCLWDLLRFTLCKQVFYSVLLYAAFGSPYTCKQVHDSVLLHAAFRIPYTAQYKQIFDTVSESPLLCAMHAGFFT